MKNSSVIYPQWVRKLTQGVAKELLFSWRHFVLCFAGAISRGVSLNGTPQNQFGETKCQT